MPTFATPGPIAATVEVAGAQVRVTASERGSVRNSVASQGSPATSDALVSVHARTRHGDIIIQRATS